MPKQLFDMGAGFSSLADAMIEAQMKQGPLPYGQKPLHPTQIAENEASVAATRALERQRQADLEIAQQEAKRKAEKEAWDFQQSKDKAAALGGLGDAFARRLTIQMTPDTVGSDPGVAGVPGGVTSRGISGGVLPYQNREYYGQLGKALPHLTDSVEDVTKYYDIIGNEMLVSGDPNLQRTGMIQQKPGDKETIGLMGQPGAPGAPGAAPAATGGLVGEGGPFAGTSIDASSFNILKAANDALLSGKQLSPSDMATAAMAWRQAFSPRMEYREVDGPDGRPTLVQVMVPPSIPPSLGALQQAIMGGVAPPPAQTAQTAQTAPQAQPGGLPTPSGAPGVPPQGAPASGGGTPGAPMTTTGGTTVTPLAAGQRKPPTEGQGQSSGFWMRATQAAPFLPDGTNGIPTISMADYQAMQIAEQNPAGIGWTAGYAVSPEGRQQYTAGNQWLSAVLRMDTGAAETETEAKRYRAMFLPLPYDDAGTVQLKANARKAAENAMLMHLPDWMKEDVALNNPEAKRQAAAIMQRTAQEFGLDKSAGAPPPEVTGGPPAAAPQVPFVEGAAAPPQAPAPARPRLRVNPDGSITTVSP